MTKEVVKEGFALAEEESRKNQIETIKKIVTKTLEKLDKLSKERKGLDEEIKLLRMDIDDLKEGKLDRIVERQEKDSKAKEVSVVVIIKEKEVIREVSPWFWPYTIIWQQPIVYNTPNYVYCDANSISSLPLTNTVTYANATTTQVSYTGETINCSVAKDATIGTYNVSGHLVHLR